MTLRDSSAGLDPAALVPGRDLVLDLPRAHGAVLPDGVLLDDRLAPRDRESLDREAAERLATWSAWRGGALAVDGCRVAHVWESELLAVTYSPV